MPTKRKRLAKAPGEKTRPQVLSQRLYVTRAEFASLLNVSKDKFYGDVRTHPQFPAPIPFSGCNKPLWTIWEVRRFARLLAKDRPFSNEPFVP